MSDSVESFERQVHAALRPWQRHPLTDDFAQEARLAIHLYLEKHGRLDTSLALKIASNAITDAARRAHGRPTDKRQRPRFVPLRCDPEVVDDPASLAQAAEAAKRHAKKLLAWAEITERLEAIEPLDDVIQRHVRSAIRAANGSVARAAIPLGIGRATIYTWLKAWGRGETAHERYAPRATRQRRPQPRTA